MMGVRTRSKVSGAQFGLAVQTGVVSLTVPDAAMVAEVYVRTNAIVFTRDGTDPTGTKGRVAIPGSTILLNSRDELDKFKCIRESANATVDVEYFTDLIGTTVEGAALVAGKDGSGNAQILLTDSDGKLILSATITGSNTVQDNSGNTDVQAKGDDDGVQYVKEVGQRPATPSGLPVYLQKAGVGTSATRLTTKDYMVEDGLIGADPDNTDNQLLVGDEVGQGLAAVRVDEGANKAHGAFHVPVGPGLLKDIYVVTDTTAADDADFFGRLIDRPGYRDFLLRYILELANQHGAYWPCSELSGTEIKDAGPYAFDMFLVNATLGDAGQFGRGIDFDGSGDYLRQKTEQAESGTVSYTETGGGGADFELDDTGAVFSSTIRDGKHWLIIKDAQGDAIVAYIGTVDVDSDSTRINLFTTTERGTQGLSGTNGAFSGVATPLTFTIFKELHSISAGFVMGAYVDFDTAAGSQTIFAMRGATPSAISMRLKGDAGRIKALLDGDAGADEATWSAQPTGRQILVTMEWKPSTHIKLYIDGTLVATNTAGISAAYNEPSDPLSIGSIFTVNGTPTNFMNGRISHPFFIEGVFSDNWHKTLALLGAR